MHAESLHPSPDLQKRHCDQNTPMPTLQVPDESKYVPIKTVAINFLNPH